MPGRIVKPGWWEPGFNDQDALARGNVGLWLMWTGAGSKAMDVSGNGYTGTIIGPTWASSSMGSALKWTDTNTERLTATVPEITNQDLSVVGWVQLNAAALSGIVGNDFGQGGWWFSTWTGGELALWTAGSGAGDVCNGNTDITSAELQHVAVVWTHATKTATFYLNGVNDGSGTNDNAITGGDTDLIIGEDGRDGTGYPWNGLIGSLGIYDRALAASEIAFLYANPNVLTERPSRVALWSAAISGGISLTPDPATVPVAIPTPVMTVDRLVTPDPVTVPVVIPTPTLDVPRELLPDPVDVPVGQPALAISHALIPDALAVPVVVPTPTLSFALVPDPVTVPVVIPAGTIVLGTRVQYDAFLWGDPGTVTFLTAGSRVAYTDDTADSADTMRATSEVFDAIVTNGYAAGLGNSETADTFDAASFFEMLRIGGTLAEAFMVAVSKVDYTSVSVGFGGLSVRFEQGGYNLYRALTRRGLFDDDPVGYERPGQTSFGIAQADDTERYYGITAVSSAGVENRTRMRVLFQEVVSGVLGGSRPNPLMWARAQAVVGGEIELSYEYDDGGAAGTATGIQVARATGPNGAGVDWGVLIQTITFSGRVHGKTTLDPTYANGETVYLAVRAVTAAGDGGPFIEPEGSPVIADSAGPTANEVLVGSQG